MSEYTIFQSEDGLWSVKRPNGEITEWTAIYNRSTANYLATIATEETSPLHKQIAELEAENARSLEFAQIMHELDYLSSAIHSLYYGEKQGIENLEAKIEKVTLMINYLNELDSKDENSQQDMSNWADIPDGDTPYDIVNEKDVDEGNND